MQPLQPPYAPQSTARSMSANLIRKAKRSLDQEIPLYENNKQRETYESLSEIHSIIIAINILEKAFIKDKFENNEDYYTNTVTRLLNHLNLILKDDTIRQEFKDIDTFAKRFDIDSSIAVKRIKIGIPATIENSNTPVSMSATNSSSAVNLNSQLKNNSKFSNTAQSDNNLKGKAIAEATGSFITLMDAIKLDYNTKEQLHPLLSDIITSTNKLFGEFDGRSKLIQWLIKLNNLKLGESLQEDDLKEFLWDIDIAYKGFFSLLG